MGSYFSSYKECTGTGQCLRYIERNKYSFNKQFFCPYDCKPKPCPNFIICGTLLPQYKLNRSTDKICKDCDMAFSTKSGGYGVLPQKQIDECGICYCENINGVANPKCTHYICIDCFKVCYGALLPNSRFDEPKFPYSHTLHLRYAANPDSEEWYQYPDIVTWIEEWGNWNERRNFKIDKMAKCPFCRK